MTYKCDGCGTVYCPHCDPGPCPGCGVDTYNGERESQLMRDLRARAEAAEQECVRLREALEGMVWQFAHRTVSGKKRYLSAGGLSALEEAWDALGWGNQQRHVKELGCARDGCEQWVEAGLTDDDGSYVSLCSDHAVELMRRQKPEKAEEKR